MLKYLYIHEPFRLNVLLTSLSDPRIIYLSTNINMQALNDYHALYTLFDSNNESIFTSTEEVTKPDLIPGETILHVFDCSNITPFHKRDGNILIGFNFFRLKVLVFV